MIVRFWNAELSKTIKNRANTAKLNAGRNTREINMTSEKRLLDRIGWLAVECGKEDAHVARLEKELAERKARINGMLRQISKLEEELKKKQKKKE